MRLEAVKALGRIKKNAPAAEPLAKVLAKDKNVEVRLEAARVLGAIGGKKARAALTKALIDDESPQVRSVARSALKSP